MTKQKRTAGVGTVSSAVTFKRLRKSPTVTPLTRQLMTKSIHRAILEYQHTQSMCASSPKSPLDLRVRAAIYRGRGVTPVKCLMKTEQRLNKSLKIDGNSHSSSLTTTTTVTTTITNEQDHCARQPNTLETVYEQEKDSHSDTHQNSEQTSLVRYKAISENGKNDSVASSSSGPIAVTPILLSHRKSIETTDGSENCDNEIWYTPQEFVQTNVIENIQVNFQRKYIVRNSIVSQFKPLGFFLFHTKISM